METFRCPTHRGSQALPVAATGSSTSGLKQTGKSSAAGRRSSAAPSSEVRLKLAVFSGCSVQKVRDKGLRPAPQDIRPRPLTAASLTLTLTAAQRAKQRQIRCNAAGLSVPLSAAQPDRCSATAAVSTAEQRECQAADLEEILKERGACGVRKVGQSALRRSSWCYRALSWKWCRLASSPT